MPGERAVDCSMVTSERWKGDVESLLAMEHLPETSECSGYGCTLHLLDLVSFCASSVCVADTLLNFSRDIRT